MRILIAPAALAVGLMLSSAALAAPSQAATADAGTMSSAEPVVHSKVVGRSMIDAPIDQLTVSRDVSYDDLNLANPADVKIADQRIDSAAKQDCAQLREHSPDMMAPTISGGHCVRSAERNARSSLKAAIRAAQDQQ